MKSIPPDVWDDPTEDEQETYDAFVAAWNDEEDVILSALAGGGADGDYDFFPPKQWPAMWCPGINLQHRQALDLIVALPMWEPNAEFLIDLTPHGMETT